MSRDLALYFSNKLASEWSASSITGLLSPAVIEDISTTKKWEALDPLVRVRLLLAPMFLRRQELAELRPALTALKSVVAQDTDEWVRVIAAAVGSYDGVLHMDAVLEHSKLVKATLEELKRHGAGADPTIFRPLEEKYLSAVVLEKRLPGSTAQRKHIPEHTHFVLRDAEKAPGNNIPVPQPSAGTTAATGGVSSNRPYPARAGAVDVGVSKPSSSSGLLPGRPPMGPSRLAAPGGSGSGGGISGRGAGAGGGSLFMAGRKPLGGGLAARATGSAALGGTKSGAVKGKKKAAIIDINAVAQLNQAAALEKERKEKEEEKAREEAALAKVEAKKLEKEAKEEKKKRDIARAAAAKEAEKEAEKARKEAEIVAAREAKEAERLRKEAAKEEAARKKAEEHAEKEAQRAQRDAEKAEKERAKAARAELKRAAAESGGGTGGHLASERPTKISKKNPGLNGIPTALATAQQLIDSSVIQPGSRPGEAPYVHLIPPQVALDGLREAQAMDQGIYGDFPLLQQQQLQHGGGGGDDEEEDGEDLVQRYLEMGKAAAAAAEMNRTEEERRNGDT